MLEVINFITFQKPGGGGVYHENVAVGGKERSVQVLEG